MSSLEKFRQQLLKYSVVGLDSCFFIYLFEDHPTYAPVCSLLIDLLQEGKLEALTADITLSEVLTAPMKLNQTERVFQLDQAIQNTPNLSLVEINQGEARLAGYYKAKFNFKLPDCLHLASTIANGAQVFLTNDQQLKVMKDPGVMCLSDFVK